MKVFLDTSAWLALEVKNDINHLKAKDFARKLISQRALLFTNTFVLSETYTRLIYDAGLHAAEKLHEKIKEGEETNLTIFEVLIAEREETWKVLKKYLDHKLSFTDAIIITQFFKYNLDTIFTFDNQFQKINLPTNLP